MKRVAALLTVLSAAIAASTPNALSSTTAEREGAAPIRDAAWRKRSGAGFPSATSAALKIRSSK